MCHWEMDCSDIGEVLGIMLFLRLAGGMLAIKAVNVYRVWLVVRLTQDRDDVDTIVEECRMITVLEQRN